jgi:hypothetical protein
LTKWLLLAPAGAVAERILVRRFLFRGMIFAILDYINYRSRRRAYSDALLRAEGGRLATEENFPRPEQFKTGDLVFLHTADSFLSWLVMYYTSSVWSHVASVSENGYIIDATTSGVLEHSFADYLDGKSYILMKRVREITDEQRQKMLTSCREQVGGRFNWVGVVRLFLDIVCGFHARYRVHFSVDFLLLAACFTPLWLLSRVIGTCVVVAATAYLLVVIATTPIRHAMRRRFLLGGIPLPHCPKHIKRDEPNA